MLAAHFAEPPPKCDSSCDLCAAAAAAAGGEGVQPVQQDLTEPAKLVVQLLQVRVSLWDVTACSVLTSLTVCCAM